MEKAYKLLFNTEESDDLYVYCCGISQTLPGHSFGPALKPHFMIHFIMSGKGSFNIGGETYPLEKDYGFLIVPDELAYYVSDEKDPWTYVWVGFGGKRAQDIVSQLGLSLQQPVFKSSAGNAIYDLVKDMMDHNTFSVEDSLRRNGLLSLFLSVIASGISVTQRSDSGSANYYVSKAQAFVRSNYCNPIKVTDIANYVCINRSYLYTLFEKTLGISPQQYLTSYRISKATELLQLTQLPIESIALSCGYTDPLVFSKAFRQEKKITPSAYRKSLPKSNPVMDKDHLLLMEQLLEERHLESNDPN
ncbi:MULTISPECIES: AraC family transcriptional regulator [unclassified Butyrivibrio]|uniref:AraC family transcriptional regulator n=1 Tax=unclassified Butyrivibrio TaxID=2639466 RepID=UPI0003B56ED0|nr:MULTISPECIES: AraC family transcriptional regulator [unclassified Butyrivibrio]MDC7292405.1 AraC family transcriptional regulator [Butyrivibrio sp. DSM 10294]